MFKRYDKNPILAPIKEHPWEACMVYNCGTLYEAGKVHILYRAQGEKGGVSSIGYASSKNGFDIDERLPEPVLTADTGSEFEMLGYEDPRINRLGNTLYITFTAFGRVPGMDLETDMYVRTCQLAMVSISLDDFINKRWNWSKTSFPLPRVDNKDFVFFPEKMGGKYVMYHRIKPHIWIAYSDDLKHWEKHNIVMPASGGWEHFKVGVNSPPLKTDKGWLVFYHGVDNNKEYRIGYFITDLNDPMKIIYKHKGPVLEPELDYELEGAVKNVVFSCGAEIIGDTVFMYYGGADTVIGVATCKLKDLLSKF